MYSSQHNATQYDTTSFSANDNFQSHTVDLGPTCAELIPDLEEGQKLLCLLDPNAQEFNFQTFGDGSNKGQFLEKQFHTDFGSIAEDLCFRG